MNEVIKFVILRPPEPVAANAAIDLALSNSGFQNALLKAKDSDTPRQEILQTAQAFMESADFVKDVRTLKSYKPLDEMRSRLKAASRGADAQGATGRELTSSGNPLTADPEFLRDKQRLFDSIIAATITHADQNGTVSQMAELARTINVIERGDGGVASDEHRSSGNPLAKSLKLPPGVFPLPSADRDNAAKRAADTKALAAKARAAVEEATQRRVELRQHARQIEETTRSLTAARSQAEATQRAAPPPPPPSPGGFLSRALAAFRPLIAAPAPATTRAPVTTLHPSVIQSLPPGVSATLRKLNIDLTTTPLPIALQQLNSEHLQTESALLGSRVTPSAGTPLSALGSGFTYVHPRSPTAPAGIIESPPANLPTAHGTLQSVGMAELKVVRQNLLRYEAREISHIENVLDSETRRHVTKHRRTTDQFMATETEVTTTEEKDLQTTDRFELKRESESVVKEDSQLKAGVSLSAKYGGVVEINTSVDFLTSSSKQESLKQASTYGKDITTRAASKITSRLLQQQTQRITELFGELDVHSFTNDKAGAANIVGIYQWVDKIYEAQVFNYGYRVMFDVMVPEPAAFLIDAIQSPSSSEEPLIKPADFTLSANQLGELPTDSLKDADGNDVLDADGLNVSAYYLIYASQYQATTVSVPPPLTRTVSKSLTFKIKDGDGKPQIVREIDLVVPEGYATARASVRGSYNPEGTETSSPRYIDVFIGTQFFRIDRLQATVYQDYLPVEPITDAIGVAIRTSNIDDFALTVEIECRRSDAKFAQWQIGAHAAITAGYLKLLGDFESRLAARRFEQRNQANFGRNPTANRDIEKQELKKACISLLTHQHFGWLDSVEEPGTAPHAYPQPDFATAEEQGSYIRFFEQAFEWEHMTYFFYPYYWGRKGRWYDTALLADDDPLYAEFLKAGAARAVFPVRPGFENAVAHYLDTGALWDGTDFVNVNSPLYLSITEEIRASQDQNAGDPTPEGIPWEVRVPTTLVKLRTQPDLPAWMKIPKPGGTGDEWISAKWDTAAKKWIAE